MLKELLLTDAYTLTFSDYDEPALAPNEVRAQAILSAISHGTEINLYRGTSPFHDKRFDPEKRLFVADEQGQAYPISLGYEWVGEVIEVGAEVQGYAIGDIVHLPKPHRATHTFDPGTMAQLGVSAPLPASLAPEQAIFLASTSIALQAIHDAQIKTGDQVAIFGLGLLGILSVQLARLNGASRIVAVDPIAMRRDLALTLGANDVIDPVTDDVGAVLKADSAGADVAIEFSGNYSALHQAIRSVRMAGLVVAAGFYQGGASALHLGEEWHHNRVTMVSSTRAWGNPHRNYPLWNRPRLRETAIDLLANQQLQVRQLLTHTMSYQQAPTAYQLIDSGSPDVLKVALSYRDVTREESPA
ncbi:MAG: zinc-binding dehydrogenase [Anaerolineae bacterium]